jgi:hypothetical protein
MVTGVPPSTSENEIVQLVERYYAALVKGDPLDRFYVTDEAAGALGPVVKVGSGEGEFFTGFAAVARAVRGVTDSFSENWLESRGPLLARVAGDIGWFSHAVWWSGTDSGTPFSSLTRWTGVCLRTPAGWRFVQLHVSEGVPEGEEAAQ